MEVRRKEGPERRDVLRLILFRVIIFTSLFISAVIIQFSTDTFLPLGTFYYLIIISYALCLIYFFIYYFWKRSFNVQVYIQIFFDLLLITALVHISGGINQDNYPLMELVMNEEKYKHEPDKEDKLNSISMIIVMSGIGLIPITLYLMRYIKIQKSNRNY